MDDIPIAVNTESPRFLDQFRIFLRNNNYSYATEKTYLYWARFYIRYHRKRHPRDMGAAELEQFLSFLAVERNCSPKTQATALNALICMYNKFMGHEIGQLNFRRPTSSRKIPVVFTRSEAKQVIDNLSGDFWLLAPAPSPMRRSG